MRRNKLVMMLVAVLAVIGVAAACSPTVDLARAKLKNEKFKSHHDTLVALEYVVFQAAWDAKHHSPPRLFGREFELTPAGNRYGWPAFYELHAWVYQANPLGMFNDWNPRVTCPVM